MLQSADQQQQVDIENKFLMAYYSDNDKLLRILWAVEMHLNLNSNVNTKILYTEQTRALILCY